MTELQPGVVRYGFRLPDVQANLLQRVNVEKALVGLTANVTFMGAHGARGTIVTARWYDDPSLGRGVWVDIDVEDPRAKATFTVHSARIRRLNAEGKGVGEWWDL